MRRGLEGDCWMGKFFEIDSTILRTYMQNLEICGWLLKFHKKEVKILLQGS